MHQKLFTVCNSINNGRRWISKYEWLLSSLFIMAAWFIAVYCWNKAIALTTTPGLGMWEGPNDAYLNEYRPFTAFCWSISESPFLVMAIGMAMSLVMATSFAHWRYRISPKLVFCILLAITAIYFSAMIQLFFMRLDMQFHTAS